MKTVLKYEFKQSLMFQKDRENSWLHLTVHCVIYWQIDSD